MKPALQLVAQSRSDTSAPSSRKWLIEAEWLNRRLLSSEMFVLYVALSRKNASLASRSSMLDMARLRNSSMYALEAVARRVALGVVRTEVDAHATYHGVARLGTGAEAHARGAPPLVLKEAVARPESGTQESRV